MSAKERDRLKVLHEVNQRHITQKQAAAELGLSVRWVRKLLVRQRRRGDGALRHGLRGCWRQSWPGAGRRSRSAATMGRR